MHALHTSSNLKYGKCCSRTDEDFVCRFLYSCHYLYLPVSTTPADSHTIKQTRLFVVGYLTAE